MTGFTTLVRTQARLLLREPKLVIFGLGLPLLLLTIFGNIPAFGDPHADLGGRTTLDVFMPTLTILSPVILAVSALPISLAELREHGVLRRMAVSPVPASGVLAAQVIVLMSAAAGAAALVCGLGTWGFGAKAPAHPATMIAAYVLGCAAILGLGLMVAAIAPTAGAASGIAIPIMIVNFFFGGLYTPVQTLPHALATIGQYVPFGAMVYTWSGHGQTWQHLAVLAGYAVVGGVVAARTFRWE
jgi:ABC-2 type transport system permease protein